MTHNFWRKTVASLALWGIGIAANLAGCGPTTIEPAAPPPTATVLQDAESAGESSNVDEVAARADRLTQLIHARLALMDDVARAKWNARLPVEDKRREAELLDRLAASGLARWQTDPEETKEFFLAQITAGKRVQQARFDAWSAAETRPTFEGAPDLALDLRPQLDRLSEDLLVAWHDVRPVLSERGARTRLSSRLEELRTSPDPDAWIEAAALEAVQIW